MSKKLYLLTIFFLLPLVFFAQVKKEVLDGIYVTFPSTPDYSVVQGMSTYSTKTSNALYFAFVRRNAIPNYSDYLQAQKGWTQKEKDKVIDALLDNTAKGKLDFVGTSGTTSKIKLNGYDGRKVSYQAINPVTGNLSQVKTTILLVRSSIVIFDVWSLKESTTQSKERDSYFNSISFK